MYDWTKTMAEQRRSVVREIEWSEHARVRTVIAQWDDGLISTQELWMHIADIDGASYEAGGQMPHYPVPAIQTQVWYSPYEVLVVTRDGNGWLRQVCALNY